MPTVDFSFVDQDVERQRRIAQDALAEVKKIDSAIGEVQDDTAKLLLLGARNKLLEIARRAAESANTTSSTATTVFTSVSASTK